MAYKWKPSKTQRKQFAINMQNEDFAKEYRDRKDNKEQANRSKSKFDYTGAGGQYAPTTLQYDIAYMILISETSEEQKDAAKMVISGYTGQTKIHHDHIHIVNEFYRRRNLKNYL